MAAVKADVASWNNGVDGPVRLVVDKKIEPRVGLLKRRCCELSRGEYIVELDHDDQLSTDCLAELAFVFEHTAPVFVYSNCVRVNAEGKWDAFGDCYGWTYTLQAFHGVDGLQEVQVPVQPPLLPQNVSRIWFAPDHVRAWRTDAYWKAGGHDPSLAVCDDEDLMCRLRLLGRFQHINKPLYRYLIHGGNTWLANQAKINDDLMWTVHDKYIEPLALEFCRHAGVQALDLGGGIDCAQGWTAVDIHNASIVADLNERWPMEDNSVGALRAHDVIEHLKNPIHTMNEAWRVLCHGGLFLIEVPSTDGRGAFQDPSHVSFFNTNSFWYYTKAATQKYIKHLGVNCRFQTIRVANYFPSDWHKLHNIVYAKVHLAAVKDGPRLHGALEI